MRAHERPRREKVTLSTPLYVSTETLGLLLLRSLPHELMHPRSSVSLLRHVQARTFLEPTRLSLFCSRIPLYKYLTYSTALRACDH